MRIIFLPGSRLHRRHLRLIIWSLILPTFIMGGCLYYLIFSLLAQQIAIPEFIAQTLFPAIKKINGILLFAMPVVFLALIGEGMVISDRLAGPLERLKKEMENIEKGNFSKRLYLRKNDELKPIADFMNKLLDKIGGSH